MWLIMRGALGDDRRGAAPLLSRAGLQHRGRAHRARTRPPSPSVRPHSAQQGISSCASHSPAPAPSASSISTACRTSTASRSRPIVSRRLEQAQEVAEKYGATFAGTELDEVLARDDVDAVILCTPTQLHAEQSIAALRAGKHVQVEIPLADSWADAQAVAQVQRETGLVCMVGHTRRFNPSHQWVHRRIAAGELRHPADGRADLLLPPDQHERARPAAQLDRPPAVAPRRPHRRPVPVPDR